MNDSDLEIIEIVIVSYNELSIFIKQFNSDFITIAVTDVHHYLS